MALVLYRTYRCSVCRVDLKSGAMGRDIKFSDDIPKAPFCCYGGSETGTPLVSTVAPSAANMNAHVGLSTLPELRNSSGPLASVSPPSSTHGTGDETKNGDATPGAESEEGGIALVKCIHRVCVSHAVSFLIERRDIFQRVPVRRNFHWPLL